MCAEENVQLNACRDVDAEILRRQERCIEAAHNLKELGSLEECVCRWMRQISLVSFRFCQSNSFVFVYPLVLLIAQQAARSDA